VSRLFPLVCLLLTGIAMALSLAHVAEMPGKMRLDRETYLTVQQQLYYPGFTIGGMAEPLGALAILALLIFAPLPGVRFWWAVLALGCLVAMQLVFWFVTQPVNAAWTRDMNLQGLAGCSSRSSRCRSRATGPGSAISGRLRTRPAPPSP